MTTTPYISVIITAYDRQSFLKMAVKSAINQSLDRSKYEVVVVKNFENPELDTFLTERNVISVYNTESRIGPFLLAGIRASSGEVLVFLDDDDEFAEGKLLRIYHLFHSYGNLGYYYNNKCFVDVNGRVLKAYTRRSTELLNALGGAIIDVPVLKADDLLLSLEADFNMSSISIRRSIIIRYLSVLERIRGAQDTFMLFCSLLSDGSRILLDGRSLTRYRIHGANKSMSAEWGPLKGEYLDRRVLDMKRTWDGYSIIFGLVDSLGDQVVRRMISYRLFDLGLNMYALDSQASRRSLLKCYAGYLRNFFPSMAFRQIRILILAFLALLSKRFSRSLYIAYTNKKNNVSILAQNLKA